VKDPQKGSKAFGPITRFQEEGFVFLFQKNISLWKERLQWVSLPISPFAHLIHMI
jgi:hypothetical protein